MPLNYKQYYTPENDLKVTWKKVTAETRVISTINATSAHIYYAYDVTIAYDGPVNIGDRKIREARLPDWWSDTDVKNQVTEETGISDDDRCGGCLPAYYTIPECLVIAACCPVTMCYYACYLATCCGCGCCDSAFCCVAGNKKIFDNRVDEIAHEKINMQIANLVKEADPIVSARIAAMEEEKISQVVPAANPDSQMVVLSQEQFQALLQRSGNATFPAVGQGQVPAQPPEYVRSGIELGKK